jgi:hypothetical protein
MFFFSKKPKYSIEKLHEYTFNDLVSMRNDGNLDKESFKKIRDIYNTYKAKFIGEKPYLIPLSILKERTQQNGGKKKVSRKTNKSRKSNKFRKTNKSRKVRKSRKNNKSRKSRK